MITESIISAGGAVIVGLLSFAGVSLTNKKANRDMAESTRTTQAVMENKITELTREVREHNNFARRVPVVEEQIKVINHRISDLENNRKE